MNPPYPPITAVVLEGWLWHWITHEGWYAIKQRNLTKPSLQFISIENMTDTGTTIIRLDFLFSEKTIFFRTVTTIGHEFSSGRICKDRSESNALNFNEFSYNVTRDCRIRRLHQCIKVRSHSQRGHLLAMGLWPRSQSGHVTCNTPLWFLLSQTREDRSDQPSGHVKPGHLFDFLDCILQTVLMANKHPAYFILKALEDGGWGSNALRKTILQVSWVWY